MKILADRNMVGVDELFAGLGEVETFEGRELRDVGDADILLVRSVTRVDESLLGDRRPRFVGTATSGYDHVDREFLAGQGIPFAHAPGSNADSVVDYVLSALGHAGDRWEALLSGEPVGIIGYGRIGRRLHERLARLGIRCLAYDPWLSREQWPVLTDLEAVLHCPVLCLHASLTRETPWPSFHMLDAEQLGQLPPGGILINAGRGELIATGELQALAGQRPDLQLVLDVWESEPGIDEGLLASCLYGTAHIAGYSHDGKLRATGMLYEAACTALGLQGSRDAGTFDPVQVSPPGLSGPDLLRWLVARVYDIREDDRALRDGGAEGFDRLRREYRRRRELSSLEIADAASLSPLDLELCRALGCRLPRPGSV